MWKICMELMMSLSWRGEIRDPVSRSRPPLLPAPLLLSPFCHLPPVCLILSHSSAPSCPRLLSLPRPPHPTLPITVLVSPLDPRPSPYSCLHPIPAGVTPLSPSLLMFPARYFGTEQRGGGWCPPSPPEPLTSWHVARNSSKVTTPSLFLSIFCKGVARAQQGHPWPQSGPGG